MISGSENLQKAREIAMAKDTLFGFNLSFVKISGRKKKKITKIEPPKLLPLVRALCSDQNRHHKT
jgi:hypothetical protein